MKLIFSKLNTVLCSFMIWSMVCLNSVSIAQIQPDADSLQSADPKLSINGYIKEMPSLEFAKGVSSPGFNNIVHNRINLRYRTSPNLYFAFEMRNRLMSGKLVNQYSDLLAEILEHDNGLIDASYVPVHNKSLVWHLNADRFYADWQYKNWQFRAGRQRINWGINMVSNPNDLFNNYSFFDFDYEERPGSDAIRIQSFTGDLSRFEFAMSPANTLEKSVAAFMYAFNRSTYDFQFIGGYYRNRPVLGGGWAGSIKNVGFKGETSVFSSLDKPDSISVVAAMSFDYLFPNGLYTLLEVLYNGGHTGSQTNLLMLTEPMSADNIFISKYAITSSLMYSFSPIFTANMSGMYMPDLEAYYISPGVSLSLFTNLDLSFISQIFSFSTPVKTRQMNLYSQLKWSF